MWILVVTAAYAQTLTPPADAVWEAHGPSWSGHDVGDVDGDGIGDLVWLEQQAALWVATGRAGRVPAAEIEVSGPGGEAPLNQVVVADVDGDGLDDVITGLDEATELFVWPGATPVPAAPIWPHGTIGDLLRAVGDVDGDGYDDLANGTQVYRGSPGGPVAGASLPDRRGFSHLFGVGDIDGDGYDDVAGPDNDIDPAFGWYDVFGGPLVLHRGGPSGLSQTPLWTWDLVGSTGWDLVAADVDGDGVDELVVAAIEAVDEGGSGALVVLDDLDDPAGPTPVTTTDLGAFDLGGGFSLGSLGDRDGDGADEVVLAWNHQVQALPWSEADGFDLSASSEVWRADDDAVVVTLRTDDVDGDDLLDLSVMWRSGRGQTLALWLAQEPAPDAGTTPSGTDPGTTPGPTGPTTDEGSTGTCGCASAPTGWFDGVVQVFARRR